MWTGVDPTTYMWDPTLCNELRESRTSNFFKYNYEDKYHAEMLDVIRRVNINDKAGFDPSITPGAREDLKAVQSVDADEVEKELVLDLQLNERLDEAACRSGIQRRCARLQ